MTGHQKLVEWILGADPAPNVAGQEFLRSAERMWPNALAHAKRAFADQSITVEETGVAQEIWENVLRSVWKVQSRAAQRKAVIRNLDHYLIVAFIHRLDRYLHRSRKKAE